MELDSDPGEALPDSDPPAPASTATPLISRRGPAMCSSRSCIRINTFLCLPRQLRDAAACSSPCRTVTRDGPGAGRGEPLLDRAFIDIGGAVPLAAHPRAETAPITRPTVSGGCRAPSRSAHHEVGFPAVPSSATSIAPHRQLLIQELNTRNLNRLPVPLWLQAAVRSSSSETGIASSCQHRLYRRQWTYTCPGTGARLHPHPHQ
jgi:hypothetical protein